MRPPRNIKTSGKYRKQQFCPQYLRSTWPTVYPDYEETATFLAAMMARGAPLAYSSDHIRRPNRKRSSRTSSTPVLKSIGDTDTEDEGFAGRSRLASVSSQGSYDIRRQTASMGSLTSSYSSLGERSASTLSPLDDYGIKHSLSTSLNGILDLDFCDYDHDPKMREAIEEIVSPKPIRTRNAAMGLAAVDPSILVAVPTKTAEVEAESPEPFTTRYSPTALCDLSVILAGDAAVTESEDSRSRDLDQLRLGTHPVVDGEESSRRGWDIPEEMEEEVVEVHSKIPYRKLSETSESEDDRCVIASRDSSLLSSSLSTESRSRSSSLSSARDSSDYLGDISGEETVSRRISTWPSRKKLRMNLKDNGSPFALSPRIPGVDYYGVPTSNISESPGRVSKGLDAFFNSRSIVHRLGPDGLEKVYEMMPCPERCGFAYPIPPREEVSS